MKNYYEILEISEKASFEEIKIAYKKAALKHHPDRDSPHASKEKFQEVSEAYFVLSDRGRRAEYDSKLRSKPKFKQEDSSWFSKFRDFIPDKLFSTIFEDLIGEELESDQNNGWGGWPMVGALSGAGTGLLIGNVPGAVIGGVAGYKLGQVRTKTGKSIYESWTSITSEQKSRILASIASKIL